MTTRKPYKLELRWLKDASKVTIYANRKKLITIKTFDGHPIQSCHPFLEGWFGTGDQNQWNFRVTFSR